MNSYNSESEQCESGIQCQHAVTNRHCIELVVWVNHYRMHDDIKPHELIRGC